MLVFKLFNFLIREKKSSLVFKLFNFLTREKKSKVLYKRNSCYSNLLLGSKGSLQSDKNQRNLLLYRSQAGEAFLGENRLGFVNGTPIHRNKSTTFCGCLFDIKLLNMLVQNIQYIACFLGKFVFFDLLISIKEKILRKNFNSK